MVFNNHLQMNTAVDEDSEKGILLHVLALQDISTTLRMLYICSVYVAISAPPPFPHLQRGLKLHNVGAQGLARSRSSSCICTDLECIPLKKLVWSSLCLRPLLSPATPSTKCSFYNHGDSCNVPRCQNAHFKSSGVLLCAVCMPADQHQARSDFKDHHCDLHSDV